VTKKSIFSQENMGELALALKTETVAGAINVALACLEIWLAVFAPRCVVVTWFTQVSLREAEAGTS
jgi:hypothetical protein